MLKSNFVIKVYKNMKKYFWRVCIRNYIIVPAKCRNSFGGKTDLSGTLADASNFIDQRTV